jgi:hypothetical protein
MSIHCENDHTGYEAYDASPMFDPLTGKMVVAFSYRAENATKDDRQLQLPEPPERCDHKFFVGAQNSWG